MNSKKVLPIAISSIIFVAFLAVSFLFFDASSQVYIAGVRNSYAETYTKNNNVEFIELYDSDNPDVEIPKIKEETAKKSKDNKEDKIVEEESVQTEKENGEFGYNYESETVNVMLYKGNNDIVVVPDTIDNLPVTTLSMKVLNKGISAVYIPPSVTEIKTQFSSPRYNMVFFAAVIVMILGYIFALISTFIGLKKSETAEGTFYVIPFVYSGLVTFIVITIWCGIALFFRLNPLLQAVVAVIIFACAIGGLLKKSAARDLVDQRGEQVKQQAQFVKILAADANSLASAAKTEETKALTKKVYEAIRYSDPMSVSELDNIENQIRERFAEFESMIAKSDIENARLIADELLRLIESRNNKCKALK